MPWQRYSGPHGHCGRAHPAGRSLPYNHLVLHAFPLPLLVFLIADLSQVEIARSLNYLLYVSNFSLGNEGQPIQRDISRLGNDLLFASGDQVRCAG